LRAAPFSRSPTSCPPRPPPHRAVGVFFEGVMTSGVPAEATLQAVQASIVAAGYGA